MKVVILGATGMETNRMIGGAAAGPIVHYQSLGNYQQPHSSEYVGFLDSNWPNLPPDFCDRPILGGMELIPDLVKDGCAFVNTISGSTVARYETSRAVVEAGGKLLDFIHPSIDLRFKRGIGCYIQQGVAIQAGVTVADNCTIHLGAIISHEVTIGHSCFVGAATVLGRVSVDCGAYIGAGAVILPDVKIGRWATVGAGAVVLHDVSPHETVVGNPARHLRYAAPKYEAVEPWS